MKKYESAPDVNYTRRPSRKLFYAALHNSVECALNYVGKRFYDRRYIVPCVYGNLN